ncbi:DUF6095 family protein [uncultured Polaribacter sp.]|uniref:DUF6095 family protein n=1 Tax=uncultured Polaribacter sp. TaxID=174711 RepID=UPI0026067B78|nr:DUF6095 family protein [uncultured Polaribacter sp.]
MSTNVNILAKGLKRLAILIFLFIISPISLTMGFKGLKEYQNSPKAIFSYILISVAGLLIIYTIFFAIRTFKILLNAFFND